MTRNLLCLPIALCLAACAGGARFSPKAPPAPTEARLYLYRPFQLNQSGSYPNISVDGKELGPLKSSGYLTLVTAPGTHAISIYSGSALHWHYARRDYPIVAEAGKTGYYKLQTQMNGPYRYGYGFGQIEEATALKELQSLKESQ